MLRTDWVAVNDIMRAVKPTLAQMPRGYIQIDAAGLSASGYAYADGTHLPDVMGIRMTRLAALANDHRDYYNEAGTLLYST